MHESKNSNRVYKCIFCDSTEKLTREHVWADWLRAYLPCTGTRNFHWTSYRSNPPIEGKLHRPGDAHSQRLQVVCKACNSGWMSSLQEKVRPILSELINDRWICLNQSDQMILAAWSTMTSMVVEFADPKTATVPQEHRRAFKNRQEPSSDWCIWIGRHDPEGRHPAYFNHFGWRIVSKNIPEDRITIYNFQTTTMTIGKFLFHTAVVTPKTSRYHIKDEVFAKGYDLRTIWPYKGKIIDFPLTSHGNESRQNISQDGVSAFGFPIIRTS